MADVWFAKDGATPSSSTASTTHPLAPALGDLLSGPSADLLPGAEKAHVAPGHAVDHASSTMVHGLTSQRYLDEEDARRHGPLI